MNTAVSIWSDLATLASRPGGWILPIGALLLLFLALAALFGRAFDRLARWFKPRVRVTPPEQPPAVDPARIHALMKHQYTAKFTPIEGPKLRPGFTRDHQFTVTDQRAR